MFPRYPASESAGARWMQVTGTTQLFPDNGKGSTTTVLADSNVANAELVVLDGWGVKSWVTGELLNIVDENNTIIMQLRPPPSAATANGLMFKLGSDGAQVDGPFGARVSGAGTAVFFVNYRVVRRTRVVTGAKGGG